MFKSVFTKYPSAFALIILISFSMLAVIIGSMINNFAIDAKKGDVSWAVGFSSDQLSREFATKNADDFSYAFSTKNSVLIDMLNTSSARSMGLMIFIADSNGLIIFTSESLSGIMGHVVDAEVIKKVEAEDKYLELTTLSELFSNRFLVSGNDVRNSESDLLGYVFICSSSENEDQLISMMTRTIIMASIWIMLAALIAVYFISDRMVSPLRSMIGAAKQFARGRFDTRVDIKSNDEIGELADAFNQMAESLDHMETMRNSFLANVSHDLRTPMTTIAGFIDGINSGAIPVEKQGYYLGIVSGEVHRLSRLVGQILDISRLESGERKFTMTRFDICEMCRLVLISFEQKIEQKKLDVEFICDEDSMFVSADKDAIYQVVYNLCDNAIKFSFESGQLRLSLKRAAQSKIRVSLFNSGKGISKADLPYIFDRFYKSDKSRGLDKSGVGLGLYIVKAIIEAHGERISAESTEGQFCEFAFLLKESAEKEGCEKEKPDLT